MLHCSAALLIVQDGLRCGFAHFELCAHFLQARGKRFNLLSLTRDDNAYSSWPQLLSASAVPHSEERQRVEGVLIRAADAELDVPRESGRSYTRIECCRREASERRKYIDAVVVRDQYQRIVPERHVMP